MRALMERCSRGVVLKRKLPARYNSQILYVTPESRLRFWSRDLEQVDPTLLSAADRWVRPGNVVWDIGANVGLFAFAAAHVAGVAGLVLAIEADTWLVNLLRKSAGLQSDLRAEVQVVPAAVARRVHLAEFLIAERGRASNALCGHGTSQQGGAREIQRVVAITLDWLLAQPQRRPDVLKIDTEGAELDVLEGAERVLHEARPTVICEVSGVNSKAVTNIFQKQQYRVYDLERPFHPLTHEKFPNNIVAVPREKTSVDTQRAC